MKKRLEKYWKKKLTKEEYQILIEGRTERAFTGKYLNNKGGGIYVCAGCGKELFSSKDKFDSGSGWPSFTKPIKNSNIDAKPDQTFGMMRTEIICENCGGHLGHLFDDGPKPTGIRLCVNSASLKFKKKKAERKKDTTN